MQGSFGLIAPVVCRMIGVYTSHGVDVLAVLMWSGCDSRSPGCVVEERPINQSGNGMITVRIAPECRSVGVIEFL
ncbi:hypothetical protein MLPF_2983 [Mycobacterium lepromatosis]|nr:hypothetical protein MLPF_2983 [Mycobacterium lepromatosis]